MGIASDSNCGGGDTNLALLLPVKHHFPAMCLQMKQQRSLGLRKEDVWIRSFDIGTKQWDLPLLRARSGIRCRSTAMMRLTLEKATQYSIYPARGPAPVIVSKESRGAVLMKLTAM